MSTVSNFIELKKVNRIWAVGSIHANFTSLQSIKEHILANFTKGDKLIFLGNIIGIGNKAKETISCVLDMRFKLLAKFHLDPNEIIFLRGAQEEMFLKLLQLQFAPNPIEIVEWMFNHGVDKTAESYGFQKEDIIEISSQGTLSISKWTAKINKAVSKIPGHYDYFSNLFHAAFSDTKKILFVNRGVDVSRPLSAQNDCFWWGYQNFSQINKPYNSFKRIVRGYQSSNNNNLADSKNHVVCTLFKQPLTNLKIFAGIFGEIHCALCIHPLCWGGSPVLPQISPVPAAQGWKRR